MENYTVYLHTTPNGKVYIGITGRDVKKRWNNGNGYRGNRHFWSAIIKYGWDNITHEVIVTGVTKKEAAHIEQELIAKYKSDNPLYGYNHSKGGEAPTNGIKRSNEYKERMSRLFKGKIVTQETRAKMSQSAKMRDPETRHRVQSDETKKKISEAHKNIPISDYCRYMSSIKNSYAGNPSARKVEQFTTDGVFVASYSCIKEAHEKTGCNRVHIGSVCRGQRKTCGGFVWRYVEAMKCLTD